MQLESLIVYAQHPFTNTLMSGMLRKAMVEYNEGGDIEAVYTAAPALNGPKSDSGKGVVVTRKPVLYTLTEDDVLSVAVSLIQTENTLEHISNAEFNKRFPGLPITM